jgi:predicted MFS family arabinose efflux permease
MNTRQLGTLFGCLFLIGSAEVVAGPMMAHMGAHFGVPSGAIAYLPAAYGLTYGGVALLAGPLSDRWGRKRPLQWGLLGFALLCALMPTTAPNLGLAVALSALTGLCAAIIQPNALSLVADLSAPDQVGRRIGHVFIGLMLAFVLTPVLAGQLADTLGWASAYWALSALGLIALAAASRFFPPDGQSHPSVEGGLSTFWSAHRSALRTPGVRWRLGASYLWLGWVAGFGAVVAEVVARQLASSSPAQAGLLAGFFGLMVMLGNLCGSGLQRWMGHAALPTVALVSAMGVWLFVLPLSSPWALALIGIPWAFGYGCAGPLHHARLSALSGRWRGTINSYHASLLNLGIFSVSALMGQMASAPTLTAFCGLVGSMALLGSALLWRQGPRP